MSKEGRYTFSEPRRQWAPITTHDGVKVGYGKKVVDIYHTKADDHPTGIGFMVTHSSWIYSVEGAILLKLKYEPGKKLF